MANETTERYNATPFGFFFRTVEKTGSEWDVETKTIAESPLYYLGGYIETLGEIEARNDPKESILISNMKCNHWDKVVVNSNSWKTVRPFPRAKASQQNAIRLVGMT